jgi:hypothetical protein
MRFLAHGILVASVSAGLVAGCPAAAHADGPTEPAAVAVTGDVHNPRSFTLNELRAFPAETKSVTFESDGGSQSHTYVGALLDDVVSVADPVVNASAKNAALTMAIRATGVDGYTVAVATPRRSRRPQGRPLRQRPGRAAADRPSRLSAQLRSRPKTMSRVRGAISMSPVSAGSTHTM